MSWVIKIRRAILWILLGTGDVSRIRRLPARRIILRLLPRIVAILLIYFFIRIVLWILLGITTFIVFIFLLLTVLLAMPIKYNVTGNTVAGREQTALVKVSYLYRLLRAVYVYENGEGQLKYYLAWYELKKRKKKNRTTPVPEPNIEVNKQDSVNTKAQLKPDMAESAPPQPSLDSPGKSESIKNKYTKIKGSLNAFLTYPNRKIIMELVWRTTKKIAKILKPKHFDISGTIGFEDPAKTGLFIGMYEAVAELLKIRQNLRLDGNFDVPCTTIDLQVSVKGKIRIIRMTLPIIGLLIKKPIRTLIKDLL